MWKTKVQNVSMEMEVRRKLPIDVQCLIDSWMFILRPEAKGWLYPCDLRDRSWDLGLQQDQLEYMAPEILFTYPALTLTLLVYYITNLNFRCHVFQVVQLWELLCSCMMFSWEWCRYKCSHSSSPRVSANVSTSYETTPETLHVANSRNETTTRLHSACRAKQPH